MSDITHADAIGFVGLGNLGQPMARALLRDGWDVAVLDSVPEKAEACVADGAQAVGAAGDLARCAAVAVAVPDDAAVEQVLCGSGLLGALGPDAVVLVHSTILPSTARRLAELGAERGIGLLDAPVSGGAERALDGELTVMVGGEPAVVARARPLLDAVGSDVRHVGRSGAGSAVKLANQLMMFSARSPACYEGLRASRRALRRRRARGFADAVGSQALGDSWVARHWGFFDVRRARVRRRAVRRCASGRGARTCGDVVAAARAADVAVPVAALLAQVLAVRVEAHAAERGDAHASQA